jgi:hypothetical protein
MLDHGATSTSRACTPARDPGQAERPALNGQFPEMMKGALPGRPSPLFQSFTPNSLESLARTSSPSPGDLVVQFYLAASASRKAGMAGTNRKFPKWKDYRPAA